MTTQTRTLTAPLSLMGPARRLHHQVIRFDDGAPMTRLFRLVLFALVLVAAAAARADAQTNVLVWVAPNNTLSSPEAQGLTYTLYVNGAVTGLAVSGAACVGVPTPAPSAFACTSPVPVGVPANIGTKLELTALSPLGGGEGPRSIPFIQAPTASTAFRKQ